jgi:quercetin dioxygenase-like cupin family protein
MIRKAQDCKVEYREHMRDGDGTVKLTSFIAGPEELNDKGRLFSRITLEPGCSIGFHIHDKDAELFYIIKGTAEYNDNGVTRMVKAGDSTWTPDGSSHGLVNTGDTDLTFMALIIKS